MERQARNDGVKFSATLDRHEKERKFPWRIWQCCYGEQIATTSIGRVHVSRGGSAGLWQQ